MCTSEMLGPSNKMLGGNLHWTTIPPSRSSNTPSQLHATESGIRSSSVNDFTYKHQGFFHSLPKEAVIVINPVTEELRCDCFMRVWKLKFVQYT